MNSLMPGFTRNFKKIVTAFAAPKGQTGAFGNTDTPGGTSDIPEWGGHPDLYAQALVIFREI